MNIVRQAIKPEGSNYYGLLKRSRRTLVGDADSWWHWLRGLPDADHSSNLVDWVIAMQHPQKPTLDELRSRLALAEDEVIRIQYADDFCFSNGAYDRCTKVRDELSWAVMEEEARLRQQAAGIATASGEPGV
jgi:hypothetical protein